MTPSRALLVAAAVLAAFGAGAQTDTQGDSFTFQLDWVETGFSLGVNLDTAGQEFVFEKEPDYEGTEIVRSVIPFGDDPAQAIGFAWDKSVEKLYLDVNRDRDLTDPSSAVFTASPASRFGQQFESVRITLGEGAGAVDYVLGVNLYDYYSTAAIGSGWAGEVELYGRRWRVGVADNMDGVIGAGDCLVVNPPDSTKMDDVFNSYPENSRVFLDGRCYDLSCVLKGAALDVTFKEVPVETGELVLEGTGIGILVLNGPARVLLLDPSPRQRVPVGTYSVGALQLGSGEHRLNASDISTRVVVKQDPPANLKLGGPVQNKVSAERYGNSVMLRYERLGIGGESYENVETDYANPPRFVVCKGDKEVGAGTFQYG